MKYIKRLLAIGLLLSQSSMGALPASVAVSGLDHHIDELSYPYDNVKMQLNMENTADLEANQEWQPILIHGTWSSPESITDHVRASFEQFSHRAAFIPEWDGKDLEASRYKAAESIIKSVTTMFTRKLKLLFYGHSHGGNVAIIVINELIERYGYNPDQIRLITLNTPVREDYQIQDPSLKQINVFNPFDLVQVKGGEHRFKCLFGDCSDRTFENAVNLSYKDAHAEEYNETGAANYTDCSNRHCGNSDENFAQWFPMAKTYLKWFENRQRTPLAMNL